MSKKYLAVFIALFFGLSFDVFAKSESKSNPRLNERFVVNALRQIQNAQITYRETVGAGNFGAFYELRQANLIDAALSSLQKYGYSFSVTVTHVSVISSSFYSVTAIPQRYIKTGRRSFYIDESCRIRGADKNGATANIDDPIIETCTPSVLDDNERSMIIALRTIHSAQMTYLSTTGNGNFGTFDQLINAGLINLSAGLNFYRGYFKEMTVIARTTGNAALFYVKTRPEVYQRTGVRSFYIDQTGVLRGADKRGLYGSQDDPPIEDERTVQENSQGLSKTYSLSAQSDFEFLRISY